MTVFTCDDLFKLNTPKHKGIVASGNKYYSNIKIGDTIWIIFKEMYFMSRVIGVETGHNYFGGRFTGLVLEESTVPKELLK